jgi:hypothetical protein
MNRKKVTVQAGGGMINRRPAMPDTGRVSYARPSIIKYMKRRAQLNSSFAVFRRRYKDSGFFLVSFRLLK